MNGSQLVTFTKKLYNTDEITPQEVTYAMEMLDPVSYVEAHHSVKGHPVSFNVPNYDYSKSGGHRPWQKAILRSMCNPHIHNVCVMKSRQLGISEVGVETLLYLMDRLSYTAPKFLYIFPTQQQMDGFLKSRIQAELNNPYYGSLVDKGDNSMEQMAIRDSDAFFRTGGSSKGLEGVDIDCILMDEYEQYYGSSAEVSGLQSLQSSNFVNGGLHGLVRRWSTPSNPQVGIDEKFRESDRHYWFIKCPYCGREQIMTFKDNLKVVNPKLIDHVSRKANPGACQYLCKYCHNPIENARWYSGHWIAQYPHQNKPKGYFISQLNAVWISPDQIYTDYMTEDTQDFYRYTLGTPYQNASLTINPKDITRNIRVSHPVKYRGDSAKRYIHITIGIDWGEHFHHAVILGMRENGKWDMIDLYQIPRSTGINNIDDDLKAIVNIIRKYQPDIVCADNGFSGDYDIRLQQLFPKFVYRVMTRSATSNGDPVANFQDNSMKVTIDKVTQAKIAISDIKSGKVGFYPIERDPLMKVFIQHWENVVIRKVKMANGQETEVMPTNKHEHPDHFASAFTYALIAMREVTYRLANNTGGLQISSLDIPNDTELYKGKRQKLSDDYKIDRRRRFRRKHTNYSPF